MTLPEAIVAMVILGIAAAGILLPFSSGAIAQADGMGQTLAAKLASDLLAQIALTDFDQIIATYDGYTEAQGQVEDATGAVFTDGRYAKFSRDVSCQSVYVPQQSGAAAANFILATVRVYYEQRQVVAISRLIAK